MEIFRLPQPGGELERKNKSYSGVNFSLLRFLNVSIYEFVFVTELFFNVAVFSCNQSVTITGKLVGLTVSAYSKTLHLTMSHS